MKINNLIKILEQNFPLCDSCLWDNSGWQINFGKENLTNITLALDITEAVIDAAIANKSNLVITHHPFLFNQTIEDIKNNEWKNKIYQKIIKSKISVYSLHTNFDSNQNGLNFLIAKNLNLKNIKYFDKEKLGVIGECKNTLFNIINDVKQYFDYQNIKVITNNTNCEIKKIIISCGAGGQTINDIKYNEYDTLFITGEMKWHEQIEAWDKNINTLIIGHEMEEKFINYINDFLLKNNLINQEKIIKIFPKKSFFI